MAIRRLPSAVIAAAVLLLTSVGLQMSFADGKSMHASGSGMFDDPDEDMVPNCLEVVALTDPQRADSDGDQIDDFEEILTYIWWHVDKCLDKEMIEASALASALYCAKNGVTFIIDHHASPFAIEDSLSTIAGVFATIVIDAVFVTVQRLVIE